MYYKKELKAALKKLKSKNDFTYQAGVNDALDLLDEMEEFIVLEASTQELTQENTQKDKVETFEEKERVSSSVLPPDFSELKQLAQELIDAPMPESVDLKIPSISSTISEDELMLDSKSNEKVPSITERPTFKGWIEPEGTEEAELTSKTEEIIKEKHALEKAQEVDVTVDSEEQEKLKKAQLLAEARAQALAEAEELEEDEDE
ncbi:hypothetical protein [Lactococcus petauri]|uniref:hypothetical protein n=1 Tax=Lactococcus petauri TaxID=1940789 RepID=UPI001F565B20|nr:hypothetical protein [Lactococcus petauri]